MNGVKRKCFASLRLPLLLLALLLCLSFAGSSLGKYVGEKTLVSGLALQIGKGEYTLKNGAGFATVMSSNAAGAQHVVFDYDKPEYSSLSGGVSVAADGTDTIRLVYDSSTSTAYILSRGDILANLDCTDMFFYLPNQIQTISYRNFDTRNVETMHYMMGGLGSLQSVSGLASWDVSKVQNFSAMFYDCRALTALDLSGWNTGSVSRGYPVVDSGTPGLVYEGMRRMFSGCWSLSSLTLGTGFNPQGAYDISGMFAECKALTALDLRGFGTSSVDNMNLMFYKMENLVTLRLDSFTTGQVTRMKNLFDGCTKLKTIYAGDGFTTGNASSHDDMFNGCVALVGGRGTTYSDSNPKDKTYAHIDGGTANPGYFTDENAPAPVSATLISGEAFNGQINNKAAVKSIVFDRMSDSYTALVNGVASVNVAVDPNDPTQRSNAISLYEVSDGADGTTLYVLSDGEIMANPNCGGMFSELIGCTGITFNNFNTSNVTDMARMFYRCNALTGVNVSGFDTSKVTNMSEMFYDCMALTGVDVSGFDTSNVGDMAWMFYGCKNLTTIKASDTFTTGAVTDSTEMFSGCTSLVGGAGTTYDDSHTDKEYARIDDPDNNKPGYFTSVEQAQNGSRSAPAKSRVGAYVNFEGRGIEVNPAS